MRGWYQFALPNGVWAAGSTCALHMYGHPSMAPVVMELDIQRFDNQATSYTVRPVSVSSFNSRVGVSSFDLPVGVSSMAIGVGVTTFNSRVGVSSIDQRVGVSTIGVGVSTSWFSGGDVVTSDVGILTVDVSTVYGDSIVTSAAGTVNVGRVGVSSFNSPVGVSAFGIAVGVSTIAVGVSTAWFSGAGIITTLAGRLSVDVSSIMGTKAVTTFAGYFPTHMDLGLTNNSTSTVNWTSFFIGAANVAPVGVSSISVGVSTSWFSGAGIVTTQAGRLSVDVSSIMNTKAVTTVAGYFPTHFDLELTRNQNSTVAFSSVTFSTLYSSVSASVGSVDVTSFYGFGLVTTADGTLAVGRVGVSSFGLRVGVSSIDQRVGVSTAVDVTSFSGNTVVITQGKPTVDVSTFYGSQLVTTAAGTLGVGRVGVSSFGLAVGVSSMAIGVGVTTFNSRVGVSSFDLPVGVSSMAIGVGVTTMDATVDAQIVDRLLNRNVSSGADGGRSVAEALYVLRNRTVLDSGTLTVYNTDDTAAAWTATVSTASGNPVAGIDPV